jgi:hypothetical protein
MTRLDRESCFFRDAGDYISLLDAIKPVPNFKKGYVKEVRDFAIKHKIADLFEEGRYDHSRIFRIFRNPTQRQIMELLTITNLQNKEVADLFWESTGTQLDEIDVTRYKHYFWDIDGMSRGDWEYVLFTPLGQPAYSNAKELWTALFVPANLTLWKMGYDKRGGIDKTKMVDDLMKMAYYKALESANTGSVASFRQAASVALDAFEAQKSSTLDVSEVINILRDVKIAPVETASISLQEISEGHHSPSANILTLPSKINKDDPTIIDI